ncbi:MAG: response regulator [Anaerolineales bacterium]|nr:response regulator [Anaerolineales bacterium]
MKNKVLYIEDNPDVARLVQRSLEERGYEFHWAQDGVSGLKMAEQLIPDVILLDMSLPDMNGFEVARRLRRDSQNDLIYIPIIAVVANALRGDVEKALAAGCDVSIAKPINLRELWARLESFSTNQSS